MTLRRRALLWGLLGLLALAAPVDAQAPTPSTNRVGCGGTITSGGAAQQFWPLASPPIGFVFHGFQLQNLSTDPMAFSELTATPAVLTNPAFTLNAGTATAAGGSYNSPATYAPAGPIYIIAATTGDKFSCVAW